MTPEMLIELIGYAASLLVLISLLMTSVVKLRIFNSIGSAIYVVYGLCIGSYPTALMNLCLIIVNVYFLLKLRKDKTAFTVYSADIRENGLNLFLQHYRNDIAAYFPSWDFQLDEEDTVYVVYANADPVGVLIGRMAGDVLRLSLDYSTPRFRDCSVGKFLYQELKDAGVKQLVLKNPDPAHVGYLKKMDFVQQAEEFAKTL